MKLMDQAVAWMLPGVGTAIRPARVVAWNRDERDSRAASTGEIWPTRILGPAFAAGDGFLPREYGGC